MDRQAKGQKNRNPLSNAAGIYGPERHCYHKNSGK